MDKFKLINGWTKEKVKARLLERVPKKGSYKKFKIAGESRITCLYRNAKGKSCAAGAFIPDEEYNSSFENEHVFKVMTDGKLHSNFPLATAGMRQLQLVHDTYVEVQGTHQEVSLHNLLNEWIDNETEE